ncbi:MAG: HU family DNA-binding protein [Rhodospirillales bacterium]|nr:HU family DNA-binding protein [Rhodospirillales bacterium]
MNKAAIVARVAARLGLSRIRAEIAMDTVLDAIAEGLAKEEDVRIAGFGTFRTKHRAARTGRNSATGESVQIAASKMPSFKAAKGLREAVKRGWQPEAAEQADYGDGEPGNAGSMLEMSDWPGGVEPVWTLLEPVSMEALRPEPAADNVTLRLAADLPDEEFGESAFVRNALIALELIGNEFLPSLTEKGRFGRDMVASMRAAMTWPGIEATEEFRTGKTLREGDVWELHLLHRLMELAGLIEEHAFLGQLTPLAHEMREPGRRGALQALLFRHLLWRADLSEFVETFPRGLPGRWPQDDIGVILWGLSNVAGEWQSVDTLRALTTVRDDAVAKMHWNAEGSMFAGRVLGPLRWFGLLEYRGPPEGAEVGWRKTALFDRFLSFDVRLARDRGSPH